MSAKTLAEPTKIRLQSHFAFVRLPFRKTMGYDEMFDSRSQRDLFHGLLLWSEVRGMGLVTGPSGAGKSITVRRFARALDESRFRVVYLSHARSTLTGFLRSINRALDYPSQCCAAATICPTSTWSTSLLRSFRMAPTTRESSGKRNRSLSASRSRARRPASIA